MDDCITPQSSSFHEQRTEKINQVDGVTCQNTKSRKSYYGIYFSHIRWQGNKSITIVFFVIVQPFSKSVHKVQEISYSSPYFSVTTTFELLISGKYLFPREGAHGQGTFLSAQIVHK
jgi:hypothetical protein